MTPSSEPVKIQETRADVEKEVQKLTSDINTLETITTLAGLIGAGIGSLLAIPFGPIAFVSGAALGAAAVGGTKVYTQSRKREIDKDIQMLQDNDLITSSVAAELRERLAAIHTDKRLKEEKSVTVATESTEGVSTK
jgi:hypothetical protein